MKRFLLKSIILIPVFVVLFSFYGFTESNRVVAVVNDEVITARDLDSYHHMVTAQNRYQFFTAEGKDSKEESLSRLIEDRLILQEAKKENIEVAQTWIEENISHLASAYPDYESFLESLEQEGLSIDYLKKRLKEQYLTREIINRKVRAQVRVRPGQISQYYQENPDAYQTAPRVVFFMARSRDLDRIEKISMLVDISGIEQAKSQFREDLSELELYLDQLQEPLGDILAELDDKTYVTLEIDSQYYFIYRKELKPSRRRSLAEAQEEVYRDLWQEAFRKKFEQWVDSLREDSLVRIHYP